MGSRKAEKGPKPSFRNPKSIPNLLGPKKAKKRKLIDNTHNAKKNKKNDREIKSNGKNQKNHKKENGKGNDAQPATASQQLSFFLDQFQSANGVRLSSLELESIRDTCMLELSQDLVRDIKNLGELVKANFGSSWKELLCEGQVLEGKIDPGSPAVLIITTSALRSLELLRGMRLSMGECHAVKLFSKHMKLDEQVSLLKNRVNIGSGTPSRIKKLIDMEALGLSRLSVVVLDVHVDVKGYSLFTLPQVRDEFWDLYKNYFHQRIVQGDLRICLYGPIPNGVKVQNKELLIQK